jgi:hypothetical protein
MDSLPRSRVGMPSSAHGVAFQPHRRSSGSGRPERSERIDEADFIFGSASLQVGRLRSTGPAAKPGRIMLVESRKGPVESVH